MNVRILFLLICALVTALPVACAQGNRYGFYFTNHRTRVQIPFQFRSNLIIIPVCINERTQAHFIVDTGVGYTIITDARIGERQPFAVSRTVRMAGVGEGSTLLASISVGNSISLGKLRTDHHTVLILNEDVLKLSEYAGMPIHGIIGYELFANLVVTIDFQRQLITLTQPDKYRYRPGKGERCPIYIQDKKAYTDALAVAVGGSSLPLRVMLDTGAGQSLLLDRGHEEPPVPMPGKVVRLPLGRGLTGMIHGEVGRLPAIYFGRYTLSNVLVAYPDSADFGSKLPQLPARRGSVGCELLRRFRLTINYPASYIVLRPVKWVLREPFENDMSGLDVRVRGDQFDRYVIVQVARDSPAERAGLQVNDELLIINNNPASTLTMGAIYRMFQAGDGKVVSVVVRRRSQLSAHTFSLKRLI